MSSYADSPAAIKGKLRRRFYEAIVFLSALTTTWQSNRQAVSHDPVSPGISSFESKFKTFVDTLSQFCDIKHGGDFVTACCVLDRQSHLEYRFACNQVNKTRLECSKAFVIDLLTTLRNDDTRDGLNQVLFEKVLGHCRTRVCAYVSAFTAACSRCIGTAQADENILAQLEQIQRVAPRGDLKGEDIQTFAQGCRRLVDLIEQCHRNPEGSVLAERQVHSSMNGSSSCWSELRHHAGRLKSYSVGVQSLLTAVSTFPRLCEEGFEVEFLQSSKPDSNPIQAKNVTAKAILGRMCSSTEALAYGEHLQASMATKIDGIIKDIVNRQTFQPIVHAELLILKSLETDSLLGPGDFFNKWKYIGSSKSTCKLCHYYFQAHDGGFQVRPSHMNMYINWKPPDVLQGEGELGIIAREKIMNKMVEPIRKEGLRVLRERAPVGREHDSSTNMSSHLPNSTSPVFTDPPLDAEQLAREADMDTTFGDSDDAMRI